MVLGLRTKTRKGPSVHLDYIIHIQEIKPWPPSQSLRALRSVHIQWEHGEKNSGLTSQVVPSLNDGKIEFNEGFKFPVTLLRDGESFQKNCAEFNLYEPRRDKMVKGQLLGTAVLDFAEFGVVKDGLSLSVPIKSKRTYGNTAQPLLFLKIEPVEKKEASVERNKNHGECVSELMSEKYAEEADVASLTTDDDVSSSHSSLAVNSSAAESNGSSSPQNQENGTVAVNGTKIDFSQDQLVIRADEEKKLTESPMNSSGNSSRSLSINLSPDLANISKKICSRNTQSTPTEGTEKEQGSNIKIKELENQTEVILEKNGNGERDFKLQLSSKEDDENSSSSGAEEDRQEYAKDKIIVEGKQPQNKDSPSSAFSQVDATKQVISENIVVFTTKEKSPYNSDFSINDRLKNVKSVRSSLDSNRSLESIRSNHFILEDTQNKTKRNLVSESRLQHLEHKVKVLEEELREAAGIEISLYSVVSEHGSSMTKVHAPARRLSRLYFHARGQNSKSRKGSAAKSIVSGLVLVSKACGNDVPRLTFWLSNSVVLRVIVSKSLGDSQSPISERPVVGAVGGENGNKKTSPLKWESFPTESMINFTEESLSEWENPIKFAAALEKVEAWIFSRIVESIWWQIFTPYMQPGAAESIHISMNNSDSSKLYQRTSSSMDQQQRNFSLELWKKSFKDACERICPVRAGGHECGCLHVLSRLIMEQLIARLDVAMFNAILRESADEIPTDPIADPISDAEVVPIPSGKASCGAGAQLKNAIGNWSRWLTDLFGIDDEDEFLEKENSIRNDDRRSIDAPSKSFHLLNALSDLMMLPKDMLLSPNIRKEVCPTFGTPIIRRVLNYFVPDEFCPDPIPGAVMEALDSEDPSDSEEDSITNFPCAASPIEYVPPSASGIFLDKIVSHSQLTRSGSSLLKKSQTSDDELDELDSPLKSIVLDCFVATPSSTKHHLAASKENQSQNTVRYKLLREVWMNSE